MCGIAGAWRAAGSNQPSSVEQVVRSMTSCLAHRGPDADGVWTDSEVGVGLGHRRLSIVDLSPTGAQPMTSHSQRFVLTFNGEIYNFRQLRNELRTLGHEFRGTSDTEVILTGLEVWGIRETLVRCNGMFALVIWDRQNRVLTLARDRMGEKPLYYAFDETQVLFASELKSIARMPGFRGSIDPIAIADVLQRGYVRGARSIYREVRKLGPGEMATVKQGPAGLQLTIEKYWNLDNAVSEARRSQQGNSLSNPVDALDELLRSVVADELLADVPVGAFLSGGIDSSLIVALMQQVSASPVRSFTIAFDDPQFDESVFAREVAAHLKTDHTEVRLAPREALRFVERLPAIFDEPFADSSQLPTLLVCETTRQFVTVALSGDGGDELFGGYSQYRAQDSLQHLTHRIPRALRSSAGMALAAVPTRLAGIASKSTWSQNFKDRLRLLLQNPGSVSEYESLISIWVDPYRVLRRNGTRRPNAFDSQLSWPDATTVPEARMAYDMKSYLPDDILVKVDRSAMAASLETRAPLLDHRVVEFALAQPLERKINGDVGKLLLRELAYRYVPRHLLDRPKKGFAVPLESWLRSELREWAADLLHDDSILAEWFEPRSVRRIWREHLEGKNHGSRLWTILMVTQWLRDEFRK